MLELVDVSVNFGGLKALDGLSFTVHQGEVLGMIGPNGSGKSTAFNVITGAIRTHEGSVTFAGEDITKLPSHRIAHRGIGRTFQVVRPFAQLTALDNVMIGRLFGGEGAKRSEESITEARAILETIGLAAKADRKAGTFTILERKWLEVGRALAGRPKLVLLDEFMAGISPNEVPHAVDLVKSINASGVTVVLVEHIVKAITGACDRVIVLDAGKKLAEGSVDEIVHDPAVIAAYLGVAMLAVEGLEVAYGDLQVVWDVSFQVPENSIVAILGSNGAGKTTTLMSVVGLLPALAGTVSFKGEALSNVATHQLVEKGLVMIPEERATFSSMSVADNLELGAYARRARPHMRESLAEVYEIFPRLAERKGQRAGTLSGGERQMLALGKALMARPELLVLDEPSLGLAPIIVENTFNVIRAIREKGVSVLMVEQHVEMTLEIADHAYILEMGRIVADGTSAQLAGDPRVREAYLSL